MGRPTTAASEQRLAEEYRALREAAAVVDLDAWSVLEVLGRETRAFLQGTATQDFQSAPPPSRAARTLFLTEKGRPVAHAWVAFPRQPEDPERPRDPDTAWILAEEGACERLRAHLERFRVMEDVEFRGPDGTPRLLGVPGPERGPLAGAVAAKIPGAVVLNAEPLSFVLAPADARAATLPPFVEPATFEAWRIVMGIPYEGVDFDADRIATELMLPEAVSLTKGCYVGQEVVARTSLRGKLRRQRIGFRFPWSGESLPAGTELRSGGLECGTVTSSAREPGTREGVGMGYITPDTLSSGLDVLAIRGEKSILLSLRSWPL